MGIPRRKLKILSEDEHDRIRWIDTSTMLCDPLTKAGGKNFADRLIKCMQTGELSLEEHKRRKKEEMAFENAARDEVAKDIGVDKFVLKAQISLMTDHPTI